MSARPSGAPLLRPADEREAVPSDFAGIDGLEHVRTRAHGKRRTGHAALAGRALDLVFEAAAEFNGEVPSRVRSLASALLRLAYDPETGVGRVRALEVSQLALGFALRPDLEGRFRALPKTATSERSALINTARQEAKRAVEALDRWQGEPEASDDYTRVPRPDRVVLMRRDRGGKSRRGNLPNSWDLPFLAIASEAMRRVDAARAVAARNGARAAADRKLAAVVRELLGQVLAGAPTSVGVRAGVLLPPSPTGATAMRTAVTKARRGAELEAAAARGLELEAERAGADDGGLAAEAMRLRADAARRRAEQWRAAGEVLAVVSDAFGANVVLANVAELIGGVAGAALERLPVDSRAGVAAAVIERLRSFVDSAADVEKAHEPVLETKDLSPVAWYRSVPTSEGPEEPVCTTMYSSYGTGGGPEEPVVAGQSESAPASDLFAAVDALESVDCGRFGLAYLDDRAAGNQCTGFATYTVRELRANAHHVLARNERDRESVSLRFYGDDFGGRHGLVHVEDVPDDVREYLEPAALLVVETSPGSSHVVIALETLEGDPVDDATAKATQERLARRFAARGVNEGARGAVRLPGTFNLKPKHERDGQSPRVRLVSAQPGRRFFVRDLDEVGFLAPLLPKPKPVRRRLEDRSREWPDYAAEGGGEVEFASSWAWMCEATRRGFSPDEVAERAASLSEWLGRRGARELRAWARRAARRADR